MNQCCYDCLNQISQYYNLPLDELRALVERPQCQWRYRRGIKKGERCELASRNDAVFCEKHHRQAGSNTNGCMLNVHKGIVEEQVYVPSIGLAEVSRSGTEQTVKIIQGNPENFALTTEQMQLLLK